MQKKLNYFLVLGLFLITAKAHAIQIIEERRDPSFSDRLFQGIDKTGRELPRMIEDYEASKRKEAERKERAERYEENEK